MPPHEAFWAACNCVDEELARHPSNTPFRRSTMKDEWRKLGDMLQRELTVNLDPSSREWSSWVSMGKGFRDMWNERARRMLRLWQPPNPPAVHRLAMAMVAVVNQYTVETMGGHP